MKRIGRKTMVRAVDPKKVNSLEDVITAYKRKAQNIKLNLNSGVFEVQNAKGVAVKTIRVPKGYDATFVINNSEEPEDVKSSGEYLAALRSASATEAAAAETAFAETQDELLQTIETWRGSPPGASRAALAVTIGRLQADLAKREMRLRNTQYAYRETLDVAAKRKLFLPLSFDDRNTPYPVYKLTQYHTLSKDRVVPIAES